MSEERKSFGTREIHDYPPMLQVYHIQEIIGCNETNAFEIMRNKACPSIRIGRRSVVPRDLFWKFIISEAVKGSVLES